MEPTDSNTTNTPQRYTFREDVLTEAITATTQERNNQYGPPHQDFSRTATMWSAYLGRPMSAHDVAAMMIMIKLSRIAWTPEDIDHWVDIAGYAACGYESYMYTEGGLRYGEPR